MKILSLDLARVVGWCVGSRPDALTFDSFRLSGNTLPGVAFAELDYEVSDLLAAHKPDHVVYEAALSAGGHKNAQAAEFLIGCLAITEAACYRAGLERAVSKEFPKTVRSQVMGRGWGNLTTKQKEEGRVCGWLARERNIWVKDHNAADAILQWLYADRLLNARG